MIGPRVNSDGEHEGCECESMHSLAHFGMLLIESLQEVAYGSGGLGIFAVVEEHGRAKPLAIVNLHEDHTDAAASRIMFSRNTIASRAVSTIRKYPIYQGIVALLETHSATVRNGEVVGEGATALAMVCAYGMRDPLPLILDRDYSGVDVPRHIHAAGTRGFQLAVKALEDRIRETLPGSVRRAAVGDLLL